MGNEAIDARLERLQKVTIGDLKRQIREEKDMIHTTGAPSHPISPDNKAVRLKGCQLWNI